MKIQIVVVKLVVLGALFIISSRDLHLMVASERAIFFNVYSTWIHSLISQVTQVTGYVVGLDWLPK